MQNTKQQFGVVFVQMRVVADKLSNIKHAETLIREAVAKYQPKLVVLPEYFNTKYGKQYFEQFAEIFPTGETFVALQHLAKELNIFLVGGSIPERDAQNVFYNTTAVFAPNGSLVAKYRKIHLIDMELEQFAKMNEFELTKLNEFEFFKAGKELAFFEIDGIKIGLGIGYDMCFSELVRLYRLQGIEMIIFPSALPTTFQWEQLNRARAIDNQMYILGVAQARDETFIASGNTDFVHHSRSILVDFHGKVLARAGLDEEYVYTQLNFVELEQYRKVYDLFAQRRTDVYETVFKQ